MLALGSTGPAVFDLQRRLTLSGYWTEQHGFYGPATEAQVRAYQLAYGLPGTGAVDAATWASLHKTSASTTMPAVKP